jgi:hypothetical protein
MQPLSISLGAIYPSIYIYILMSVYIYQAINLSLYIYINLYLSICISLLVPNQHVQHQLALSPVDVIPPYECPLRFVSTQYGLIGVNDIPATAPGGSHIAVGPDEVSLLLVCWVCQSFPASNGGFVEASRLPKVALSKLSGFNWWVCRSFPGSKRWVR